MTEEIINSDGSRNWEANILLDNIKRLEQERDDLKEKLGTTEIQLANAEFDLHFEETRTKGLEQENRELKTKLSSTKCYLCGEGFLTPEGAELYEEKESYRSALEEIKTILDKECGIISNAKVVGIINEVLNENN